MIPLHNGFKDPRNCFSTTNSFKFIGILGAIIDVHSGMSYKTQLIDFVNPRLYRAVCSPVLRVTEEFKMFLSPSPLFL